MIQIIEPESLPPILVDLVTELSFELVAELTSFPVEDGSTRTDNKVAQPARLTLSISQTEHPIDDPSYALTPLTLTIPKVRTQVTSPFLIAGALVGDAINAIGNAIGLLDAPKVLETFQTSSPRNRGGELAQKIAELWASTETSSISFKGRVYERMELVSVTERHTAGSAGLSGFDLSFEELRTFSTTIISLPDPLDLAHKPPIELGKKAAPEEPAADALGGGSNQSVLEMLREAVTS